MLVFSDLECIEIVSARFVSRYFFPVFIYLFICSPVAVKSYLELDGDIV